VTDSESPSLPTWYARRSTLPSGLHLVSAFQGTEVPDGETLHAGKAALWSTEPASNALIRVTIAEEALPKAPAAWFVSVTEPRAEPPAMNLVAYVTDDFPPGTIINQFQFGSLGLSSDEQAGAIRWLWQYALVHQVFVSPEWRRGGLATALVYTASAFHQANGWPGRLHSNGQRTELGERFATALDHPGRIAPLDETMPPMDPAAPPVE
jgi:GNAT superfamily N-acetyltransferase